MEGIAFVFTNTWTREQNIGFHGNHVTKTCGTTSACFGVKIRNMWQGLPVSYKSMSKMYALMYPILYIASIHCYISLSTATSILVCNVCIVLWHDHVNGEIKALKKKKKKKKWSFVHHFKSIGEYKLELQSGEAQFGSKSAISCPVWPWHLTDDLEKQ